MSREIELLFAENIKKCNYKIDIVINQEEPYTLYCCKDIGETFELRNIRSSIYNYDIKKKVLLKQKTKGGEQTVAFFTYSGFMSFLCNCRKTKVIEFCKKMNIDIDTKIYCSIEIETIQCILDGFNGEEMICQYRVDDYLIDLYFPKYNLAIECDEPAHNSVSNKKNDIMREQYIKNKIGGIVFLRYEPYNKEFNIFQLINNIYIFIKQYENNTHNYTDMTLENIILAEKEKQKIEVEKQKTEELILRKLNIELELKKIELELQKINKVEAQITEQPHNDVEIEIDEYIIRKRNNTRSPKVYQYEPEEPHNLIKIYDCEIDVSRENPAVSSNALKIASRERTIYKGFRWLLVDRTATEIPKLEPTVIIRQQEIDYVAMLDVRQQTIEKVYSSQKEGALDNGLANCGVSTISRAIKNGTKSCNRYWKMWKDCSKEMQEQYLKTNSLPEKFVSKNALKVIQIEPKTKKEVGVFYSKTEVLKKYQMGMTKLNQVCRDEEIYKGFIWKIVGDQ